MTKIYKNYNIKKNKIKKNSKFTKVYLFQYDKNLIQNKNKDN